MKQPWWRHGLMAVLAFSAPFVVSIVGVWVHNWLGSGNDGYATGGFLAGVIYSAAAHGIYGRRHASLPQ
ncbi:MAG: hypothetical protein ACQSGP_26270 [Frankia sp.]